MTINIFQVIKHKKNYEQNAIISKMQKIFLN